MQHRLFKTLFWISLLATGWFSLKQCDRGRLSEAFAMADAGIRRDRQVQELYNLDQYHFLRSYVGVHENEPESHRLEAFEKLQQAEQEFQFFLDSLRGRMLSAAGLSAGLPLTSQPLREAGGVINRTLLNGNPNGLEQIANYSARLRASMIAIADGDASVIASLPLDFTAGPNGRYRLLGQSSDFRDLPLAGALAVLSDLQAAAALSMSSISNYLLVKTYSMPVCCWCKWIPGLSSRSSYIQSGRRFEADIFLTDMCASSECTNDRRIHGIWINGQPLTLNDGIARYQAPASTPGEKTFTVEILGSVIRENRHRAYRDTFRVVKEFAYTVLPRPWISQSPSSARNCLYAGVENPVTTNGQGFTTDGGTLKNLGDGHYSLKPAYPGLLTLTARSGEEFVFPVRLVPRPVAVFGGHAFGEAIPCDSLAGQTALGTRFPEDFNFEADCRIVDFRLSRFRPRGDPEDAGNEGGLFNERIREMLETALPGDRLFFYDIRVQCSGDPGPGNIDALALRVR